MSDVSILLKLTVDANTRKITIPNNGTIFGVVGDVEINRVMFSVPRYYSGFDMKDFIARVNYVNPNGEMNFYESSDMAEVDDTITFSWLMSSDVTKYAGDVRFSIKLYKVSGNTYTKSFNTTTGIGKVLEGLDVEKQVTPEQQTTLLSKLETDIKASIDEYVNNQVTKNVNTYIENNVQKKVDAVVQEELAELKKDSVVQQVETNRTDITGIKGGIIVQQATQPTSDTTQIWVDTSDEEEIEVPDIEEFNSLKDETNSLKEEITYVTETIYGDNFLKTLETVKTELYYAKNTWFIPLNLYSKRDTMLFYFPTLSDGSYQTYLCDEKKVAVQGITVVVKNHYSTVEYPDFGVKYAYLRMYAEKSTDVCYIKK